MFQLELSKEQFSKRYRKRWAIVESLLIKYNEDEGEFHKLH